MEKTDLTAATKQHYEELVGQLGEKYFTHRWGDHPIKRSHYRHTQRAIDLVFSSHVRDAGNLLEVGCGPGVWTDIMLRHSQSVTLLDISEEMLKVVKHKYRDEKRIKDVIQGDYIEKSKVLADRFDVVFSSRALEYMSDKRQMVLQSYQLLNPGGSLIIITKNPAWRDKRIEASQASDNIQIDWIDWPLLMKHYRDAGFKEIAAYPVALGSYYWPFSNRIGILLCDLLDVMVGGLQMTSWLNPLSESYLVYGRK